jgi:glycosyltransferase involved in cell wall biosynthesis
MIVVFDARGIRAGMTGVGRYAACLADALCRLRPRDEFVFLGLRGQDSALRPPATRAAANARWIEVAADPESHPAGDWWMHAHLPRLLRELRADVFHGPAFVVPFGWRRVARGGGEPGRGAGFPACEPRHGGGGGTDGRAGGRDRCALVVTLHDLCAFRLPRATPWRFGLYLRWAAARSVAAADRAICPTEFVCDAARRLFGAEPPEKFVAVAEAPVLAAEAGTGPRHLSAGSTLKEAGVRPAKSMGTGTAPAPPLLMVGTFETRKNPLFLLRLYEALRRHLPPPLPPIVWVGRRGHGAARLLDAMEPLRAAGLFRLEETANDAALAALYRSAAALVYPSLDEGFGLPLVEAMAAGLPVLAARASCLPEVVGTGGQCLPLDAPDAWAAAIAALLTDPRRRADASACAQARARDFSWEKAARRTFQVYEAAVAARRPQ